MGGRVCLTDKLTFLTTNMSSQKFVTTRVTVSTSGHVILRDRATGMDGLGGWGPYVLTTRDTGQDIHGE